MKLLKFMNILYYIITFFFVYFAMHYIFSPLTGFYKVFAFIFGLFYILTWFCHRELRKELLQNYYMDKEDLQGPTEYMLESFTHSIGLNDYKCNTYFDISDYSEEEIQKALNIYEKIKYKI